MQTLAKELSEFFESCHYQRLLHESCAQLEILLNENFPEILYEYDFKKLKCSALGISDLRETVVNSQEFLLPFIKLKFTEDADDTAGEFPRDETLGEEDRPKVVKQMPAYRNFLLGYLIEFTLLKTQPDMVTEYLKCARIPNAATYSKRLKNWYNKAQATQLIRTDFR